MPSVNFAAGTRDSRTDHTLLIDIASQLSPLDLAEINPGKLQYNGSVPTIDPKSTSEMSAGNAPKTLLLPKSSPPNRVQRSVSLSSPRFPSTSGHHPLLHPPSKERHHRRVSSSSSSGTSLMLSMTYDDEAIEELWENLRKRQQLLGSSHHKVGLAYNHIGNCHFRRGEMDAALSAYFEALKVYKDDFNNHNEAEKDADDSFSSIDSVASAESGKYPALALCMCNIGTVQWRTDNINKAVESLEESVRIFRRFYATTGKSPTESIGLSTAWYNLGLAYSLRADYSEALEAFEKARAGFASTQGVNCVDVARVMDAMGKVSLLRGNSEKALACHRTALRMKMATLGYSHPSVLCSMMNVAAAYKARSELEDARSMYYEVLRVQKSILSQARQVAGNGSWSRSVVADVAQTLNLLGLVNEERGDIIHAIKCYDESLESYIEAGISQNDNRVVKLRQRRSAHEKIINDTYLD
mmetsp:Transcript_6065/g.8922  ORF Transcript_6065/g.8922 Transcript_6065/m.8922 type:complete len:469 (+) Transcript_6065:108-1514(+)